MNSNRKKWVLIALLFSISAVGGSYLYKRSLDQQETDEALELHDLRAGNVSFRGSDFDVIRIRPEDGDLRLFWKNENGNRYGSFNAVKEEVESKGEELLFATNSGIFSKNFAPGGLHIENGEELKSLNLKDGEGNFHLKPNGVFIYGENGASIFESSAFDSSMTASATLALQSGPMLVIDQEIHPVFTKGSVNKYVRNGVGVASNGDVFFVISKETINFYDFATFFRDKLNCPNALYLDGSISDFYLPEVGRNSLNGDFAGIVGLVKPAAPQSAQSLDE